MAHTKIHDLQAFVAVARARSFSKAATRLGMTPSALSHAMLAQFVRDYPDITLELTVDYGFTLLRRKPRPSERRWIARTA